MHTSPSLGRIDGRDATEGAEWAGQSGDSLNCAAAKERWWWQLVKGQTHITRNTHYNLPLPPPAPPPPPGRSARRTRSHMATRSQRRRARRRRRILHGDRGGREGGKTKFAVQQAGQPRASGRRRRLFHGLGANQVMASYARCAGGQGKERVWVWGCPCRCTTPREA